MLYKIMINTLCVWASPRVYIVTKIKSQTREGAIGEGVETAHIWKSG